MKVIIFDHIHFLRALANNIIDRNSITSKSLALANKDNAFGSRYIVDLRDTAKTMQRFFYRGTSNFTTFEIEAYDMRWK